MDQFSTYTDRSAGKAIGAFPMCPTEFATHRIGPHHASLQLFATIPARRSKQFARTRRARRTTVASSASSRTLFDVAIESVLARANVTLASSHDDWQIRRQRAAHALLHRRSRRRERDSEVPVDRFQALHEHDHA